MRDMIKEFWFNEAFIYKTGRKGKSIDVRYADDYEEWALTLRGRIHKLYIKFNSIRITVRANLRYYFPIIFGETTQEDCIYELRGKSIKTKIVSAIERRTMT